jgi:hypothetical protein
MRKNIPLLAVGAIALALAACASRSRNVSRSEQFSADVPSSTTTVTYEPADPSLADGRVVTASSSRVTRVDISRRSEYQSDLSNRLDTISREIDTLHDAALPGSECERRMGYLQALRDSLKTKVSDLSSVSEDQYESKYLDLEDRYAVIQRFLENDRLACTANR